MIRRTGKLLTKRWLLSMNEGRERLSIQSGGLTLSGPCDAGRTQCTFLGTDSVFVLQIEQGISQTTFVGDVPHCDLSAKPLS